MNRCLTEGRQALSVRLAGIQGGIECAKLAPLLSALADGEASAEQLSRLRPHMKTCLACRATLRAFREAPDQVAALSPPAALLASDPDGGPLRSLIESIAGAAQQKAAVVGDRAGAVAELATGQKIAAVAASAAALAGGGTAVDQFAGHQGPPQPPAEQVEMNPVKEEAPVEPPPAAPDPVAVPGPPPAPEPAPVEAAPVQPVSPEPSPPPPPPPDPANEFAPGGTAAATSAAPAAPAKQAPVAPAQPAPATPAPAPARPAPPAGGGGGSSEFAP